MNAFSEFFGAPRSALIVGTVGAVVLTATQQWFVGLSVLALVTVVAGLRGSGSPRTRLANALPVVGWFVGSLGSAASAKAATVPALNDIVIGKGLAGLVAGLAAAGALATHRRADRSGRLAD